MASATYPFFISGNKIMGTICVCVSNEGEDFLWKSKYEQDGLEKLKGCVKSYILKNRDAEELDTLRSCLCRFLKDWEKDLEVRACATKEVDDNPDFIVSLGYHPKEPESLDVDEVLPRELCTRITKSAQRRQ